MILQIVCVRDRAADVFGQPNFTTSLGGSIRSFGDEVNRVDANNMLNRHPEDFELYHLGTYDDSSATFELLPKPRQIAIGKDCVVKSAK